MTNPSSLSRPWRTHLQRSDPGNLEVADLSRDAVLVDAGWDSGGPSVDHVVPQTYGVEDRRSMLSGFGTRH